MQLKYVDTKEEIIAINRKSKHIEPHLHNALEMILQDDIDSAMNKYNKKTPVKEV